MGAELEHLRKYSDSTEAYNNGIKILEGKVPSNHPIYQTLIKAYDNLKKRHKINKTISFDVENIKDKKLTSQYKKYMPYLTRPNTGIKRSFNVPMKGQALIDEHANLVQTIVRPKEKEVKAFIKGMVRNQ